MLLCEDRVCPHENSCAHDMATLGYHKLLIIIKRCFIKKFKLDVSKLPQAISQSTIGTTQNESKSVDSLNKVITYHFWGYCTSTVPADIQGQKNHPLQVSNIPSCLCISYSEIGASQSFVCEL